jgi:hypothetical protein
MSIGVGQVFRRDGWDDNRELEILAFCNDKQRTSFIIH